MRLVPRPPLIAGGAAFGAADAVVADGEFPVGAVRFVAHRDQRGFALRGERIFQRIDDEFGDDEADADGIGGEEHACVGP